ncbi:hypothetical protein LXL04_013886 [Taraxacum kok-saghyz]
MKSIGDREKEMTISVGVCIVEVEGKNNGRKKTNEWTGNGNRLPSSHLLRGGTRPVSNDTTRVDLKTIGLVSRNNLTRVSNPFATREPGQPSVRRRGMTTTSHTDPDASLSLLRRIGDTSITRVVKDL